MKNSATSNNINLKNRNIPESNNSLVTNIRNIYQCEIEDILNIKTSNFAKKYLRNNMDWHPKYTLQIERWGKKHSRYLSNKILGTSHAYVVWFCNVWGELKVRIFRRSNSEWCRRAWLWEEITSNGDIIISKWQKIRNASYETTTKVDYRIANELDKIPNTVESNFGNHPHSNISGINWTDLEIVLRNQMESLVDIHKLFKSYPFTSSCDFFSKKSEEYVINQYKNLWIEWLDLEGMKLKENGNYSYKHKYLWTIDVKICTTTWNGKPIDIHFARSRDNFPEKIWIDNIIYSDARINSFWTYDKQINAAPLTAKPIEYISQSPKDMQKWHQVFWSYVDIRDLYQETPLIKKYKEKFCKKAVRN